MCNILYSGVVVDQSSEDDNGDIPVAKAPSREAVYDFSDSEEEEELENRLKKIEANIRRKQKHSDSSESDLEEDDKIESRSKAWGKRRDDFYGADVSTKVDLGVSSGDEEAEARMEEEEARLQQQRLLSEIDESDYYLFMDKPEDAAVSPDNTELAEVSSSGAAVVIPTDLSTLSDKEKEALLKQKYPEFMDLMIDYRDTMIEYQKRVDPLIWAHDKGLLPDTDGIKLIRIKRGHHVQLLYVLSNVPHISSRED
ncbi:hypothetical protein EB796_000592 [Bugula neritina]|uniref:Uncharacterized protein n=1 Tax=Bugula neritina TaxID=10212 RepID=A0A7J7KSN5_BUGNE|nr:hypothetical protein EB796_000592 [Bugula neritina]